MNPFQMLSKRQHRVLLIWSLVPVIATAVWLQNGGHSDRFDDHLVYSFAIATLTWLWIDLGRWPARRLLGLANAEDWPSPLRTALWISAGVIFGYIGGITVGDVYGGQSTWALLDLNAQRFWSIVASSLLVAMGFTGFFWQQARANQLARQTSEAQLRLLQSQLDPHLMFNTLAHLRAQIQTQPQRATEMLDRFSDYLRSTLSATLAPSQSLAQEFARLHDYLALMQLRMGERLRCEVQLPPELETFVIPSLLLQPLVENAIEHGLEPHVQGGTVHVSAGREGEHGLCIRVSDNGAGCAVAPTPGFGLQSVVQRVRAFYGDLARVDIQGGANGMSVTLHLPLQAP